MKVTYYIDLIEKMASALKPSKELDRLWEIYNQSFDSASDRYLERELRFVYNQMAKIRDSQRA